MSIELYRDIAGALFLLFFFVGIFTGLSTRKLFTGLVISLVWPSLPVLVIMIAAWDIDG